MSKIQENGMWRGEEVMLILRELYPDGFKWTQAINVYASVYGQHYWEAEHKGSHLNCGPCMYVFRKQHVHMTVGNLLRSQLKGGVIKRQRRGFYIFDPSSTWVVAFPLYCAPGNYVGKYDSGRSDEGPNQRRLRV